MNEKFIAVVLWSICIMTCVCIVGAQYYFLEYMRNSASPVVITGIHTTSVR